MQITIFWMIPLVLQMISVSGAITANGEIKSSLNGICLDVEDNINEAGTNVRMWNCNGQNAQKWNYNPTTQEIKNVNGKCLDVKDNINEDGTNIRIWGCNGHNAQKWTLNANAQIQHINGRCLDVDSYNLNAGANVQLWSCHGGRNQWWYGPWLPAKGNTIPATTITIETRQEQGYYWIWNDEGSGSDTNGAFWIPQINHHLGESFISFVNTIGYHEPNDIISRIITAAPANALKEPISYQWIWDDSGSDGDHDVWFYKPVPPIDYICLGDFVSRTKIITSWAGYKCIHKDYINQIDADKVTQIKKWNDEGSNADDNGQVIQINVNGYPGQYFRMRGGYANDIAGPFYTFNQFAKTCKITKIEAKSDLSNQLLTGTADTSMALTYFNHGVNVGTTKGFGQEKCITSSSSFTHTSGSKMSIQTTFGYKRTVGASAKAFSASAELSFELSIYGEIYKEYSETITNSQSVCTNIPEQEISCPGRTQCKRDYFVFTAPNTIIPVEVTVQCGSNTDIIKGSFKATGAASIFVQDTFHPLDCVHYTDDYDDRGKGKLPFCDTCSSTNSNVCRICRDGYVLVDGGCWEDRICVEECKGTINSPSQTVPHSTTPDFAGRYCVNEDVNLQSCKTALRRT